MFISSIRIACFLAFCLTATRATSQLYNNGAVIRIAGGGNIFCSGNVTNVAGGSISNDGVLEAQGDFVNGGIYTSTTNRDTLRLTGTAAAALNSGSATFNNVLVNKIATAGITLLSNTTVGTRFELQAGYFSTDPASNFELIAPASAIFSFATGTQVTGKVRRTNWTNNTRVVFNQPNMALITSVGTGPSSILVNMVPGGDPSAVEREVKRSFNINATGGAGYTADVTFPYAATELNTNTEANLVAWHYAAAAEWNAKLNSTTVNTTSDFVTSAGITADLLAGIEWKLADPRYTFNVTALPGGAWNGTSLNTALNTGGILPLAQPYNTTPFNYNGTESVTSIPNANVVDWVLLELRKPATGLPSDAGSSAIIGRKACFVLNNGSIVNTDGVTPASFDISKQGPAFVAVRHLNHLGVLSNVIPSNPAGTFSNDFSVLSGAYKDPTSPSEPLAPLQGNLKYGLWPGDANKNGVVNATDISAVKSAIAAFATGYELTDINRSNSINATDVSLTKATIAASGTGSLASRMATQVKSSLPD